MIPLALQFDLELQRGQRSGISLGVTPDYNLPPSALTILENKLLNCPLTVKN